MKKLILPVVLVVCVFIGMGDRFLPAPLNAMSLGTRTSLNKFVMGLVPTLKPQHADADTEKAVNDLNSPQ
jgi:hypothetical protein